MTRPPETAPGAGGDPAFRLREILLAGFGLHREPVRFLLPEHATVWHAPNESGKSTLVHAVAAVLFGLPATTDRSKFGLARFRSLDPPRQFWGEIAWTQGRHRYRLHRSFASHRVRLLDETGDAPTRIFDGEHNPGAHSSAGSAFPRLLRERIGCGSLELFLETFCVAQPLADRTELSTELQHLLSGSRSGRVDDVLLHLFTGVKRLTRATGDLGLVKPGNDRPANQRDPGEIERLEAELQDARRRFNDGESLLEELNRNTLDLEETTGTAQRLRTAIARLEERLGFMRRWLELDAEAARRREALRQTRATLARLDELENDLARLEPDLGARFAPFRQAPEELPSRLEQLSAALRELEERITSASSANDERTRWTEEAAQLRRRLEGEFAALRGRPDLLSLHEQLVRARRRSETRAESIRRLDEELAGDISGTGKTGEPPTADAAAPPDPERVRPLVDAFRRDLRRLREGEVRIGEIDRELAGSHFLEQDGRFDRLREKIAADESLRDLRPRLRILEQESEQRLRDVAHRRDEEEAAAAHARHAMSVWLILVLAAAVGAGLRWVAGVSWIAAAGAGAAALVVLFAARGILLRRAAKSGSPPSSAREPRPPTPAGDQAPLSEGGRDDAALRHELEEKRAEAARLEQRIEESRKDLGPFADMTATELARLEERSALLRDELDRLAADREGLLSRHIPAFAGEEWETLPVAALRTDLREAADLPDAPPLDTCARFAAWLESLDDAAWQRMIDASIQRRRREERMTQARAERERLAAEAETDREIEELEARLHPFSDADPREELVRLMEECTRLERQLADAETRRDALPDVGRTEVEIRTARQAVLDAIEGMRTDWPGAPPIEGDLPARSWVENLRETERTARRAWDRARQDHDQVRHLLETARTGSRDELERRGTDEEATLGATLRAQEELERSAPSLGALRSIEDPVARTRRLEDERYDVERKLEAERSALQQADDRHRSLLRELASLEGRAAPNVARLELDLRAMETRLRRLRRDREARVTAFRWVREAAEEFQVGYRDDLESRISAYFAALTAHPDRSVRVDERFRLTVREPDGSELALAQLSQGASDQLLLSIRFAVADLLSAAVTLPLFLDDPFVHCDEERLERIRDALARLASTRQWILLTHRADLADWAAPIRVEPLPAT